MFLFTTELRAIDPEDNELKTWQGPHIKAISFKMAELYCHLHGLGYLKVTGRLVSEIDEDGNETDYNYINN